LGKKECPKPRIYSLPSWDKGHNRTVTRPIRFCGSSEESFTMGKLPDRAFLFKVLYKMYFLLRRQIVVSLVYYKKQKEEEN
jgi:hypothetical protein